MRRIALCALASLAATAVACDDGMIDGEDPEDSVFVDDGKADDFFSVSAQEYWTGRRATHRRALSHMLRLAEEIAARDATVEDYHRSLRECGSTVAEVALKYLDYTTARRRHERTKDG